jgi:hypothetical protein
MTKKGSRKQKGGSSTSGWSYVYNQVGDGWTQFQNALTLQPGQNLASQQSNDIEPRGKPNFQNNQSMPTANDLSLIQRAGRRKSSRRKRGGTWANVIGQAAVPFTLLGLQNTYKKRKSRRQSRRKSRRSRKR